MQLRMAEAIGFEPIRQLTLTLSFQDCCRYPESLGLSFHVRLFVID